jgi:site-specific DNA-methyltransferase (adenine-specific)
MMAKKQPMKNHENVVVFYKKQPVYNPQMTKAEKLDTRKKNGVYKLRDDSVLGGEAKSFRKKETGWRYPKSVQLFNNSDKTKNIHPTQKPVELFEYLIKTYTNEGDLVLDNCAGSGTTAIACLNTNRQFIVMEKEQKYYDIILKRVEDFNKNPKQPTLFGDEM